MIDLNELKRLAEAATPGPWCWDDTVWDYDPKEQAPWLVGADDGAIILTGTIECKMKSNADFIAAANPAAILELIARASAAQDSAPAELPPLPPLPEWVKMDDLAQLVPSEVRIAMRAYGQACADAALADAALSRPVAIPEGYKLVPLEPTPNMCDEVVTEVGGCYSCSAQLPSWGQCTDIYKAMLAAAPASPQPLAKVLTLDWPACNPACEYEDPYGGIHDCRSEGCSCEAAKASIARQRAASTPTTLTEKKDA